MKGKPKAQAFAVAGVFGFAQDAQGPEFFPTSLFQQ